MFTSQFRMLMPAIGFAFTVGLSTAIAAPPATSARPVAVVKFSLLPTHASAGVLLRRV